MSGHKVAQTLASGIDIRQDYRDNVRFVMFETGFPGSEYATHGGTAFIVCYRGRYFAITCGHVFKDFKWRQLALTDKKFGKKAAGLKSAYVTSPLTGDSDETYLLDIFVLELSDDVDATFFDGDVYVIDEGTGVTSDSRNNLSVNGALKDRSVIGDKTIAPVFALLELTDMGPAEFDGTLRKATAKYEDPGFDNLLGICGSPVFNMTRRRLSGVVVMGGLREGEATVWYVDIFDVMRVPAAILDGSLPTEYRKEIVRLQTPT